MLSLCFKLFRVNYLLKCNCSDTSKPASPYIGNKQYLLEFGVTASDCCIITILYYDLNLKNVVNLKVLNNIVLHSDSTRYCSCWTISIVTTGCGCRPCLRAGGVPLFCGVWRLRWKINVYASRRSFVQPCPTRVHRLSLACPITWFWSLAHPHSLHIQRLLDERSSDLEDWQLYCLHVQRLLEERSPG